MTLTSPATTARDLTVLLVDTAGAVREEVWTPLEGRGVLGDLQTAVGGLVDVVELIPAAAAGGGGLDLWVHDEGMLMLDVNPLVTLLALAFGRRQPYYGPVALTGGADADGQTQGLDAEMVARVRGMLDDAAAAPRLLGRIAAAGGRYAAPYR